MAELPRKACLKGLELGDQGHLSGLMKVTGHAVTSVPSNCPGHQKKWFELPGVPSDSD